MPTAGLGKVMNHIRRALNRAEVEALSDAQLLARFVAAGDEESFTALLGRYGPMVLGVCRRVLQHEQDAEDAFQATFLVMARKAASLRPQTLASWLHEVASRTALEARTLQMRRRSRERQVEVMPHPALAVAEPCDWVVILDREVDRLPLKYRTAIVLCELQGRSRAEAAGQLGVPEGTLSSRLAKGKQILARRLSHLAPAGAALVFGASGAIASPVVLPAALAATTVKSALLVAAGFEVTVAPAAVVLMKGVLKTMFLMKIKFATVMVMLAAMGAGGIAYQSALPTTAVAQEKPKVTDAEALRRENELLKLNLEVLLKEVRSLKGELAAFKGQSKDLRGEATPNPMGDKLSEYRAARERVARDLVARSKSDAQAESEAKRLAEVTRNAERDPAVLRSTIARLQAALDEANAKLEPPVKGREYEAMMKTLIDAKNRMEAQQRQLVKDIEAKRKAAGHSVLFKELQDAVEAMKQNPESAEAHQAFAKVVERMKAIKPEPKDQGPETPKRP